ncbi:MAG: LysR family transcriptional regulator [Verrucomicrobiales bacterium]|nr:LysR family transcriptional regulator [Verrucomicrobiales bacterium]
MADAGGSIVGAARGDAVRQSLLSRQIRELEECFGTELVRRKGRGLVLTDAGSQLAALGRSQLAALDDFAATASGRRIRISFAAPESFYQWVLLPRLASLRQAEPRATFVIHQEDNAAIASRVQEGVYDFGIVRQRPERRQKAIVELGHFDYVLAAPKSLVRGRNWSLANALRLLPLALPLAGEMRQAVETFAQKEVVSGLNVALEFTSYLHASAALRSASCAAIIPSIALAELPADRFATWLLAPLKLNRAPFSLIWNRRNAAVRPTVATLSEAMKTLLSF